ncbi:MAG: hypothetical protein DRJ05_16350 [Bacteroidetes bacterium]|nr:MAG: hypothetical protein DRJ05_16350 [Bacteroidota bacterium]
MALLEPNCTLWKKQDGTELTNVCSVAVPAVKKLQLRSGDPTTTGSTTLIRYDVVADPKQRTGHVESNTEIFPWDGEYHEVTTQVIEGPLSNGTVENSDAANPY